MNATSFFRAASYAAALALTACSHSDSPPPPPTPVIGPAGGMAAGPNGAQVVVPAGALAANTAIAVDQSSAGSPTLPAGMNSFGAMYAFTPHGTTFAVPVTITVPFTAASVPAGATPALFKTNAAGAWEPVPNAVANAGTMTAQVTSFSFMIVGVSPPQITTQPASQSVTAPATATFSVTAIGFYTPFTFQWQKSDDGGTTFAAAPGVNDASSYTTGATVVATDNGDQYRVLVSSFGGTSPSTVVTLTVMGIVVAPTITTQPQSVSGAFGNASFSVVATGTNLVYQWFKNGVAIADATNASLNLVNVQTTDAGNYTVVVSNLVNGVPINSVTSNVATLTVTAFTPGTWQQLGGALDTGPVGSGARDLFAAVALDLTGNPVVAWKGRVVGPGTSTNTIFVKRWDGANWVQLGGNLMVTATGIAGNAGFLSTPSIDIDPSTGHPLVAWAEAKASGPCLAPTDVYVRRWDGGAWQPSGGALNVDAAACAVMPKVRVTAAGTPIVAWAESDRTAARMWNGTAWINFGASGYVSTIPTLGGDIYLTALTLDSSGNPFVVFGGSGGPFAVQGSGSGWAMLGNFNNAIRTSPAPAYGWSAAIDALGRTTVLLLTHDVAVLPPGIATTLRVRQFDSGTWADFGNVGNVVLTADRNTLPNRVALAIPFGTSNPIASVEIGGPAGRPPGALAQSFARWDGAAWQPLAPNFTDPCELAVRANAATVSTAQPVVACVRAAGNQDIVVYRHVP